MKQTSETFPLRLIGVLLLGIAMLSGYARAATPVTIVGPDLKPERVQMQGLSDGVLTYFDSQRRYQSRKLSDLVQVRQVGSAPADARDSRKAQPVVELIDGQRLFGKWIGAENAGETLLWQNDLIGEVKLSLDRVRSITWHGEAVLPRSDGSDHVLLANGDELSGFVVAVTSQTVEVRVGDQREALKLPLDRVRALQLANAGQTDTEAHLIWLNDGTRVRSRSLRVDEQYLMFDTGSEQRQPLSVVRRIDIANKAGRLVDLAELWFIADGGEVFGVKHQPRFRPEGFWMHAPVKVTFNLPEGAQRLAMIAEVADDGSGDVRWADMDLIARVEDESTTWHLSADAARIDINMPIRGRQMTIELSEGRNGPVMDRVLLREAVLLVK